MLSDADGKHGLLALQLLDSALRNQNDVAAQLCLDAHLAELSGQQRVPRIRKAGL